MNILIIGSGGRESAFAYKISKSPKLSKLFIAPGNAGTGQYGENVALKVTDFKGIADFALANNIEMIVVGPEEPLVKGIHDYFLADEQLARADARAKAAGRATDAYVHEHPWQSIGVAAGIGLLLGMLIARR